jgi:exoribonuclease II
MGTRYKWEERLVALQTYGANISRCARLYTQLSEAVYSPEWKDGYKVEFLDCLHDTMERMAHDEGASRIETDEEFIGLFRELFSLRSDVLRQKEMRRKYVTYSEKHLMEGLSDGGEQGV